MKSKTHTRFVAFVDKDYGAHHPFVDSVLLEILGGKVSVDCYFSRPVTPVSGGLRTGVKVYQSMPRRRGLGRILIFFHVLRRLMSYNRSSRIILFVRNDPLMLLACIIYKSLLKSDAELIFQSSFPHESHSGNIFLRGASKIIFRAVFPVVDKFVAVSEIGLSRLRGIYFKNNKDDYYAVPLLSEITAPLSLQNISRPRKFVYIGDTSPSRGLNLILEAFRSLFLSGAEFSLHIYGDAPASLRDLAQEFNGTILLRGKVPRLELQSDLSYYDFGLCLIPPVDKYLESSPTKLGEYMSHYVVPIVNLEISSLKEVGESEEAVLVCSSFSVSDIKETLWSAINMHDDQLLAAKNSVYHFSQASYSYHARSERIVRFFLGDES
ncbi:glycosyltransferase [Marinobacterium sp. xm-a-152]|uniref:glycosyltransferase n=1 Tax=Marinobacterium sp. xm-a-152 TaxID=2497733 RepID=UPI00156A00FC|nr:glycosyltransferase [Marinobacterium sp. xm-a-152]